MNGQILNNQCANVTQPVLRLATARFLLLLLNVPSPDSVKVVFVVDHVKARVSQHGHYFFVITPMALIVFECYDLQLCKQLWVLIQNQKMTM
jgi:hypothetical protein